jgi:hypothetical protein
MKLKNFTNQISAMSRVFSIGLLSVLATVFFWQGAFFLNNAAIADPLPSFVVAADLGDRVQDKVSKDTGRAKGFIRDTADKVERTAKKNADRLDNATDGDSMLGDRAKQDARQIKRNAERDASRTEKAVDKTKNAIEQTVESVKDALGK